MAYRGGGPAISDTVLWGDGQPQRLRRIVLKHHLEFPVGEAVRAHHLRKGAYARRNGLGGAIIWNIGEGYVPEQVGEENALLEAVDAAFVPTH